MTQEERTPEDRLRSSQAESGKQADERNEVRGTDTTEALNGLRSACQLLVRQAEDITSKARSAMEAALPTIESTTRSLDRIASNLQELEAKAHALNEHGASLVEVLDQEMTRVRRQLESIATSQLLGTAATHAAGAPMAHLDEFSSAPYVKWNRDLARIVLAGSIFLLAAGLSVCALLALAATSYGLIVFLGGSVIAYEALLVLLPDLRARTARNKQP